MKKKKKVVKAINFVAKHDFNRAATHKVKKGKGSFTRKSKHKKCLD